ncbi:HNH endonuclease signature motif containing protein [Aliarcobacter butzleri]|uniref:HNH endonuclease signature motif containing protein n=1 Tax=Aliarcobacter butzleri TaxID=28197 RepID=UPI001260F0D9|nr:HNH endonuclease signature motif containing protein [Aliarcobacter butzleri]
MLKQKNIKEYLPIEYFFNPAVQKILRLKRLNRIIEMSINPMYWELIDKRNKIKPRYSDVDLLKVLDIIVIELGEYPTSKLLKNELRKYNISLKTYTNRFQNLKNIQTKYYKWVDKNKPEILDNYIKKEFSKKEKEFIFTHITECECCGSKENLVADHWLPWYLMKDTSVNNIQVLCTNCNRKKSSYLPITIEEFEKEASLLEGWKIRVIQKANNKIEVVNIA